MSLRARLKQNGIVLAPGIYDALSGLLAERAGFEALYLSGASIAYTRHGGPDIGLVTMTEVADTLGSIRERVKLPLIVDGDTGFGNALNVMRTVRLFERAGASAIQLEDQTLPKRCGHLDNKVLVDTKTMVQKIKAAASARRDPNFVIVARTDAKESEGLDAAIERCKAYVDAGADVIFPEAMHSEADFAAFRTAIKVPLLANLTEFGKTPLLTKSQLENLGYNIVIYPVTSLRLAMKNIEEGYAAIKRDGTNAGIVGDMQTRKRLYEVLHYEEYGAFDQSVYNFKL